MAHQGPTLHATDPFGIRLELCAPHADRAAPDHPLPPPSRRLGPAHRPCALLTPHLEAALGFYTELGFWLTEYVGGSAEDIRAVFLHRKGNPHDLVFFANGDGPRLHHVAFMVPETQHLLRASDIAGELGYGRNVERGPGRHGPGHALFVYFRDPDGHRVELFNTHYQVMDLENEPVRWDLHDPAVAFPGASPPASAGSRRRRRSRTPRCSPRRSRPNPMTLERYLAEGRAEGAGARSIVRDAR